MHSTRFAANDCKPLSSTEKFKSIQPFGEGLELDIDWGTIFFLVSFFVIIGAMNDPQVGVLTSFANSLSNVFVAVPGLAYFLNLWVGGVASAFIDNIPITITLIPIVNSCLKVGLNREISLL